MSTRDEPVTRVSAVRQNLSPRLQRWAARRTRQLLRVFLALSFVLVLMATAALIWRGTCLINLPDIGDPFDVATVYAGEVPDDRNAFILFRQAGSKLRPQPVVPRAVPNAGPAAGWSKADPRIREWVEANREALELFRRGAEQADGLAHPAADETAFRSKQPLGLKPRGFATGSGSRRF